MRHLGLILAVVVLLVAYFPVHHQLWENRGEVRRAGRTAYILPTAFNRILSLRNHGLFSDYLLLKAMTQFGGHVVNQTRVPEEEWDYIVRVIDAATDLDPYFLDPYVFTEGVLVWTAGRLEQANRILEKGLKAKKQDWRIPFFLGFNHYYFMKENEKAAQYMMRASEMPDSPSFLPNLAARLAYYSEDSRMGVMFLKGILAETSDPGLRKKLGQRLLALEGASLLEEKVREYRKNQGNHPGKIADLLTAGLIEELPPEPYGGNWIILESGRVYSTSRFANPEQRP